MAEFLGPNVTYKVSRGISMSICVTVEAGNSPTGTLGAAVFGLVELLLRKRTQQQPQALDLFRVQDPIEKLIVVVDREQLPFGNVPEIGPRGEIDGCWKFRQDMIGEIKIEVEADEVTTFLSLRFMWNFGKSIPPSGWLGWGKGKNPAGKRFCAWISSGLMAANLSQVIPMGSLTRTPS
jgi:hypothetical protein